MNKETLEEAAFRLYPRLINDPYNPKEDDNKEYRDIWISGVKWQQERSYTEEDIINALHSVELKDNKDYSKIYNGMKEWFEKFKK
jgi:hypothetical protein